MDKILKLYTYNGDAVESTPFPNELEQVVITDFQYDANRMGGSPSISATVMHRLCLDDLWTDTVYAEFNGGKYFVMNTPSSNKDNDDTRYEHEIELLSEREVLNHIYFIDAVQGDSTVDVYKSNSTKVIFMGDINEFASRLNSSLSYSNVGYNVVVDEGVVTEAKLVSFEDKYIMSALQEMFNIYEVPYYFVGKTIHIGYTGNAIPNVFKYGFEGALLSISKNNANYEVVRRCTGIGSSDNIPYYYPNNSPKGDASIRIISGSLLASQIIITDYEKFVNNMSPSDVCSSRTETDDLGIRYAVWSINGKDIKLSDIGLRLADGVFVAGGVSFGQDLATQINYAPNLMPPIYRETLGAERFYNAVNDTYPSPEGGYYTFENLYSTRTPNEKIVSFEDIKPSIVGMTNANGQRIDQFIDIAFDENDNDEIDEEGNYIHPYFFVKLPKYNGSFGFNLFDHAIENGAMTISMTNGVCGACNFEIGVGEETQKNIVQVDESGNLKRDQEGNVLWENQVPQDRQNDTQNYEVWIALKKEESTYGQIMPNASQNLKPSVGDTFVILNINLPQSYILAAEEKLKDSIIKYMFLNNNERFTFSVNFSRIYFAENPDVLAMMNENARILIEYNGKQHTLYISSFSYKMSSDSPLPEISVELTDELAVGQNSLQNALDQVKNDILSSISGGDFLKQGLKYFIRKDIADTAQGKITFNSGLQSKGDVIIGKSGFAGGLAGFGTKIGSDGRAEMRALTLWEFLEVPELRFNSVKVFLGIDWQVAGAGIIESCTPDTDSEGNELTTGTCTLKLEEGQYGAVDVDDIALGIWHFGNSNDATEDSDDGKGGFTFAGFATSYFRITEVSGANNETFRYSLRPNFNVHPQSQMTFACYGNFTNAERQTSTYRTRTYTRRLWKQNTWEIGVQNIAMQEGDLSNLSIFGMDMTGYSMYINSVYFTGTVSQVKPDGTPVMTANDRGEWVNNTKYDYYDRVSHNGCIWLCVNEDGTETKPSESNPNWLLQVSKGDNGQDGTSFRILGRKDNESQLPTDGNEIGDGYLINGHLWVWNGIEWNDVGVIQGPAGESVINMGGWYDGLHVPYLGVVRMGNATFMCTKKEGTYNPPYYTLLDNQGNRIMSESGYILSGTINNAEYQLIAADGTDGKDGLDGVPGKDGVDGKTLYTWIMYADDAEGNGISNDPTGKSFIGFAYNKESQLESNNPEDYIWSDIKGEQGVPGEVGADGKTYYTWIAYSDNPDGNPMYQQPNENTKYIGIAVNKESQTESSDPNDYTWSRFKGEQGDKGDKGDTGDSISLLGQWYEGMVVPYLGVVTMGGNSFAAKVATANPPMWTIKDNNGNRIKSEKGYILTGEYNTEEYDLIAEKGKDGLDGLQGADGKDGIPGKDGVDGKTSYFHIKYSENENGNPMTETPSKYIGTYVDFEESDSDDYTKYAWARFEGIQGEKGEQGIPGYNGADGKTYYLHIKYSNDGGSTFTGNNGEDSGDYIGVLTDLNPDDSDNPSDYKWSKIKGEQGDKGDGYTQLGQWYSGLLVPKMGVVSMGGGSYVAKVATYNPPLWTLLDNNGNRLKCSTGYLLTGSVNTTEYDVWSEKGDKGDKGDKGEQGDKGDKGETGAQGKQGIDGCVVRDSEWTIGTEYRNDSNITDGSLPIRYIDVVLVRNDSVETGWDVYRCKLTHISSESITYENASYWEKFGLNVGAIFTSLIIAKNAKIQFLQGNQLTIQKSDGTITAGLSGSESGGKIRMWAGDDNPDTAPFRVNEGGELWANKAHIQGEINATSGYIGGIKIESGYIGTNYDNNGLYISNEMISTKFSSTIARIGYDVGGVFSVGHMAGYFVCNEALLSGIGTNVGLYVSVSGAKAYDNDAYLGNHALYIPKGDICGFRLRTRRIEEDIILGVYDSIIIAVKKDITIRLGIQGYEDGQIYYIRNHTDGYVNLYGRISDKGYYNFDYKTVKLNSGDMAMVIYDIINNVWTYNYMVRNE